MSGDLNISMTADEKEVIKAQAKVIKQQDQMIADYKKLGAEARNAGTSMTRGLGKVDKAFKDGTHTQGRFRKGFSDMDVESRASFATIKTGLLGAAVGFGTLTTATQIFGAAMADAKAKTEGAMQAVEAQVEARRRLLQVSEGTGGESNQAMNDFADELSKLGISRAEARSIVFAAKSEGYQGSESLVARLGAANVLTPEAANRAAGQVRGIFKDITPIQAIAGVVDAAQASRLDVESFMAKMPKLAGGAKVAGSSAAEANAILSAVATEDERAGEYVATLANSLAVLPEFSDKPGIMGMVKRLQGMPEEERRGFLGTGKEANLSYMWLTDYQDLIAERTSRNQGAMNDAGAFLGTMEARAYDPSTREGQLNMARRQSIIAKNEQEISRERRLAAGGFARNTFATQQMTAAEEAGIGPIAGYARGKAMQYLADAGAPQSFISGGGYLAERSVSGGGLVPVRELTNAFMSFIRGLDDAGERFQDRVSGGAEAAAGGQTNAARANQAAAGGATEAR